MKKKIKSLLSKFFSFLTLTKTNVTEETIIDLITSEEENFLKTIVIYGGVH